MEAGEWGKDPMADGSLTFSDRRAFRNEAVWKTFLMSSNEFQCQLSALGGCRVRGHPMRFDRSE